MFWFIKGQAHEVRKRVTFDYKTFLCYLEWDSDMATFLLLLHILPPQSSKKKMQKISAAQAVQHLVVFHKVSGTEM